MIEFDLQGRDYIELNKLLKITNLVSTGGEANIRIDQQEVMVNGQIETRRRNKLREGDIVVFGEQSILIRK
jgi:ribosome-associated protein